MQGFIVRFTSIVYSRNGQFFSTRKHRENTCNGTKQPKYWKGAIHKQSLSLVKVVKSSIVAATPEGSLRAGHRAN